MLDGHAWPLLAAQQSKAKSSFHAAASVDVADCQSGQIERQIETHNLGADRKAFCKKHVLHERIASQYPYSFPVLGRLLLGDFPSKDFAVVAAERRVIERAPFYETPAMTKLVGSESELLIWRGSRLTIENQNPGLGSGTFTPPGFDIALAVWLRFPNDIGPQRDNELISGLLCRSGLHQL